jgi:uncharacterized membrane protein YoaK (UPF0700 family)
MRDKAVVTKITGQDILVVPLITDACLSCKNGCAKRGKPFTVSNKKNLPVQTGTIVKISASPLKQAVQGITALLFPVICAVAGYLAAPAAARTIGRPVTEGFRAGLVLLFLALSSLIVYLLSRSSIHLTKSEIAEIC